MNATIHPKACIRMHGKSIGVAIVIAIEGQIYKSMLEDGGTYTRRLFCNISQRYAAVLYMGTRPLETSHKTRLGLEIS